jgi:hypothetical protein
MLVPMQRLDHDSVTVKVKGHTPAPFSVRPQDIYTVAEGRQGFPSFVACWVKVGVWRNSSMTFLHHGKRKYFVSQKIVTCYFRTSLTSNVEANRGVKVHISVRVLKLLTPGQYLRRPSQASRSPKFDHLDVSAGLVAMIVVSDVLLFWHTPDRSLPFKPLDGEAEVRVFQQDAFSSVSLPVLLPEPQAQGEDNNDDEDIAPSMISHTHLGSFKRHNLPNASSKARHIIWSIVTPEDQSSRNAANTTNAGQGRRAKRSTPLPTDVVRLVGHDARYSRVDTDDSNANAKVLDPWRADEAHNRNPDQRDAAQGAEYRPTCLLAI